LLRSVSSHHPPSTTSSPLSYTTLFRSNDDYAIGFYVEEDLPFYGALARNFTTLDRSFCSILGPTFPNRIFLHAAQTERSRVVKRSEEHTSELQSQSKLVCRLLLEKKNK